MNKKLMIITGLFIVSALTCIAAACPCPPPACLDCFHRIPAPDCSCAWACMGDICCGGNCCGSTCYNPDTKQCCGADHLCDVDKQCCDGSCCDTGNCQICVYDNNNWHCESACDSEDCETCDGEGNCIVCNNEPGVICCHGLGRCCDPNDCESCDQFGLCALDCNLDACETCDGQGNCEVCGGDPNKECCGANHCCDNDDCMDCNQTTGLCDYRCDSNECETCDGDGNCEVCNGNLDQACCGGQCYDTTTQGCCNGQTYNLETQKCCSDTEDDYVCDECEECGGGSCSSCESLGKVCSDGLCVEPCEEYEQNDCDASNNTDGCFKCPGISGGSACGTTKRVYTGNNTTTCSGGCPGDCQDHDNEICYMEYTCAVVGIKINFICAGETVGCNYHPGAPGEPSAACAECGPKQDGTPHYSSQAGCQ